MNEIKSNHTNPTLETAYPNLESVGLAVIHYGRENNLTPMELSELFHLGVATKAAQR
jgi:hypothetical protein